MREPSGDQRGEWSTRLDEISRRWLPSANIVEIWVPPSRSALVKTIWPWSAEVFACALPAPSMAPHSKAVRPSVAPLRINRLPPKTAAPRRADQQSRFATTVRTWPAGVNGGRCGGVSAAAAAAHAGHPGPRQRRLDRRPAGLAALVPGDLVPAVPGVVRLYRVLAAGDDVDPQRADGAAGERAVEVGLPD